MQTRKCTKCNEVKLKDSFTGRRVTCNKCLTKEQKSKALKEAWNLYNSDEYEKLKDDNVKLKKRLQVLIKEIDNLSKENARLSSKIKHFEKYY